MTLDEILEFHSPLKMAVELRLKGGTEFRASRGFGILDRRVAALTVVETWLHIAPSAISDIDAQGGQISTLAFKADYSLEVAPMEAVYAKGDCVFTAYLTLSNKSTRSPLKRFLQTYGDKWSPMEGYEGYWEFAPQNVPDCASLRAQCKALYK